MIVMESEDGGLPRAVALTNGNGLALPGDRESS